MAQEPSKLYTNQVARWQQRDCKAHLKGSASMSFQQMFIFPKTSHRPLLWGAPINHTIYYSHHSEITIYVILEFARWVSTFAQMGIFKCDTIEY